MTKRALSLGDLVNHDDGDKTKLQKFNEETESHKEEQPPVPQIPQSNVPIQQDPPKRHSNVSDILNNDDDYDYINTRANSNNATRSISSNDFNIDSDETDTDDEIGGNGEVNFDSGMTFDYDKQDRNSPQKVSPTPPTNAGTKVTKLSSVPEDKQLPKPKNISEDDIKAEEKHKRDSKEKEIAKTENNIKREKNAKVDVHSKKEEDSKDRASATVLKEEKENNKESTSTKGSEKIDIPPKSEKSVNTDRTNQKPPAHADDKKKSTTEVNHIFEEKISSESKRNNIKKDLQVLQEIASASKPNKYKNVPIWAQKWKPTLNALQQIDNNDFKLDPSFLNIIPDDDLTKSVQDWIYATIFSIAPEMRQFIELEMKFGIIRDGGSPDRINPSISSQAIYTELDAHMTPNIDETLFKELNKYIRGIGELTENSGKFNVIESTTKDSLYRVGISTQRPRFLRMSTDVKTGRVGQFIEKRHVAQLLLYSPKDSYDVKISLNLELPVPENDPPEKYQSQAPISVRTKDRVSYIHNDSCTRIDVTKVDNHNQKATKTHLETTYEVELEINTPALLSAFDNITTDSKQYASLIRTFLNNGTIVRRKLTSLSSEIFEGTKK